MHPCGRTHCDDDCGRLFFNRRDPAKNERTQKNVRRGTSCVCYLERVSSSSPRRLDGHNLHVQTRRHRRTTTRSEPRENSRTHDSNLLGVHRLNMEPKFTPSLSGRDNTSPSIHVLTSLEVLLHFATCLRYLNRLETVLVPFILRVLRGSGVTVKRGQHAGRPNARM